MRGPRRESDGPAALLLAVLSAAVLAVAGPTSADDGEDPVARGAAFATERCADCHAVGPTGASPLAEAPPFRDLHLRYPVEHLAEALAEGIAVGHPAMPQFVLEPEEVEALILYLQSLEGEG